MNSVSSYHQFETRQLQTQTLTLKPGVRAYPDVHPAALLLAQYAQKTSRSLGRVLDISATAGAVSLLLPSNTNLTIIEPSRAALRCAKQTFAGRNVTLIAAAPWESEAAAFDTVFLVPYTDRGTLRVQADIQAAYNALKSGGQAYIAMDKDQGAKRYENYAKKLFGDLNVVAKHQGWRIARATKKDTTNTNAITPSEFVAAELNVTAYPGVFAAGKLDPGTGFLLANVPFDKLAGKRVLDVGCGYGLIAIKAALAGARVTAVDDDYLAVKSTRENAARLNMNVQALHSDIDSDLTPDTQFNAVVMNPPFHVAKQVRLEVPAAFIHAAQRVLKPGGDMTLVANKALAYERLLQDWKNVTEIASNNRFKILRAYKA